MGIHFYGKEEKKRTYKSAHYLLNSGLTQVPIDSQANLYAPVHNCVLEYILMYMNTVCIHVKYEYRKRKTSWPKVHKHPSTFLNSL